MGEAKHECRKCGRPYERGGKFFERHEAKCDGKYNPASRRPRGGPKPPAPPSAMTNILAEAKRERQALQKEIEAAKARKEAIVEEIERMAKHAETIDGMIEQLEEARKA